jgi:hypothetical protein
MFRERIKLVEIDRGINETPIMQKRLVCFCLPLETYHIRLSSIAFTCPTLCYLTIVAYIP